MITIEEQGATTKITTAPRGNTKPRIRRINADEYVDVKSGEVKQIDHSATSREENVKSLRRTMRNLRALINTNIEYPSKVLWVTFTYAENMTDPDRLREDWEKAWKRFLYYFEKNKIDRPEYITAAEPQGRGAWHLHALLIFPRKRPYIRNDDMAKIWRHGFTKTKRLTNASSIAAYLCAYLCDITEGEAEGSDSKRIIKGGRLYLYPKAFHLFRCSRGVRRPTKREATPEEADEIRDSQRLTGRYTIEYTDEATGYEVRRLVEWYVKDKEKGKTAMSKANPLAGKSLKELEALAAKKKESRAQHVKTASRLAKEIASIEREIENAKLKEELAALKKQQPAKK